MPEISDEKIVYVRQIMSKDPFAVRLDDSLKKVKAIFDSHRFHHLLVVESNKLFGIISDRDLLKALSPRLGTLSETQSDIATLNKKAHQIMSHNPVVLAADATIHEAVTLFNAHNISCIPIVDNAFKPIGIVSWRDILRTLGAYIP